MAQLFNMAREVRTMEAFDQIVKKELPKGFLQNASLTDVLLLRREKKNRNTQARRDAFAAIDRRVAARERKGLAAIALTTDTSVMTSISNDYGYENVFARQLEALVKKGDILWAISTSGSSANVVAAAEMAKKKGACVLAFTGQAQSKLERIADICFCAADKSTARSQEIHQIAYHIICELVEQNFCQ